MPEATVDVAIAGGGPFGLMLTNELGRRGVRVALFDAKPSTAVNPQANATQARAMEHYRRLGFADEVPQPRPAGGLPDRHRVLHALHDPRARPVPAALRPRGARAGQHPVGIVERGGAAAPGLAEVRRAGAAPPRRGAARRLDPLRVAPDGVRRERGRGQRDRRAGRRRGVAADRRYLVGADGARSAIRRRLEIGWTGETGVVRDFFGGRTYAIYLRAPAFYDVVSHAPARMNVTFNRDRRAFMAAVDGQGEFAFHTQLREGEDPERISGGDAAGLFHAAAGARIDAEVLSSDTWTAGHALVAECFRRGRVFLGGDAAHLFTPAGGLGYNAAVEDAVNRGWKLAAAVKGVAGPRLLDSYELERRPAAVRNTGYARGFAESLGSFVPQPGIEDDGPRGEELRREAGEYLERHGRAEFDIPGITFGTRYEASPVMVYDGSRAPPDAPNRYEPSASPGGRAPHLWLGEGRSLFDAFGFEWTLLRLGPAPPGGDRLADAARRVGIELEVVDVPSETARELYEAPLALVRPDQVVAWRGGDDARADAVAAAAVGHAGEASPVTARG